MGPTWTLTIRAGPRVERARLDSLEAALGALRTRLSELVESVRRDPPATRLRRYGPEQQVVGRLELSGPQRRLASTHAGVDVRGDGSTAVYLGRVRRRSIERREGEDEVAALRRVLGDG